MTSSSKPDQSMSRIMADGSRAVSMGESTGPNSSLDWQKSSLGLGQKLQEDVTAALPDNPHRSIANLREDHSSKGTK